MVPCGAGLAFLLLLTSPEGDPVCITKGAVKACHQVPSGFSPLSLAL